MLRSQSPSSDWLPFCLPSTSSGIPWKVQPLLLALATCESAHLLSSPLTADAPGFLLPASLRCRACRRPLRSKLPGPECSASFRVKWMLWNLCSLCWGICPALYHHHHQQEPRTSTENKGSPKALWSYQFKWENNYPLKHTSTLLSWEA